MLSLVLTKIEEILKNNHTFNLVFSFLRCVFCTIICLFVFLFLAMALSVYFLSMSMTFPLVQWRIQNFA